MKMAEMSAAWENRRATGFAIQIRIQIERASQSCHRLTVRDSCDILPEIDPNRRRIHMITALGEINSQTGIRSQTIENRVRTLDIEAVVIAPLHADVVRVRTRNRKQKTVYCLSREVFYHSPVEQSIEKAVLANHFNR
jgi:hypothetical protein